MCLIATESTAVVPSIKKLEGQQPPPGDVATVTRGYREVSGEADWPAIRGVCGRGKSDLQYRKIDLCFCSPRIKQVLGHCVHGQFHCTADSKFSAEPRLALLNRSYRNIEGARHLLIGLTSHGQSQYFDINTG